jgi:hypothetical protein
MIGAVSTGPTLKFEEPPGGILWITTELMQHCAMPTTPAIYLSAPEYSTTLETCLSKRSVSSQ